MPYSRRRVAGLKSNKHEISFSNLGENASTTKTVQLIKGVKSADADAAPEVEIGHKVNAIYFETNLSAEAITTTRIMHWTIEINYIGMTVGLPSTYYQDNRAFIIKRGMEMIPKDVGTIIKRVFLVVIPPKYRRVTNNMVINLRYVSTDADTQNFCGFAIFKEIY